MPPEGNVWVRREELTCRGGPAEEDGVGYEHEQHRCVRGDVVRDGVLEALFTAAPTSDRCLLHHQKSHLSVCY